MSEPAPWLSVVIPAYNEAARVAEGVAAVRRYLEATPWTWEILLVDDGSSDATADIAEVAGGGDARVRVLRRPHLGKGGAVRAGMLAARGRYRLMCDCDQSTPIEEIERFLPPALEGADIAIASRAAPGARRDGEPFHRSLVGRVFRVIVRATLVEDIGDTQCGFKVFRDDVAEELFGDLLVEGWAFDVEVLHRAQRAGLRVVELPVAWRHATGSSVRILRDSTLMLLDMSRIWLSTRGRRRR